MLSNSTTRLVDNYKERIAGTKATIFLRNGIFQINYYLGDGAYKSQSLKTSKLEEARQRARLLLAKYEYRISEGLPVHGRVSRTQCTCGFESRSLRPTVDV
jgi:hypothetical protein